MLHNIPHQVDAALVELEKAEIALEEHRKKNFLVKMIIKNIKFIKKILIKSENSSISIKKFCSILSHFSMILIFV